MQRMPPPFLRSACARNLFASALAPRNLNDMQLCAGGSRETGACGEVVAWVLQDVALKIKSFSLRGADANKIENRVGPLGQRYQDNGALGRCEPLSAP
eukprot:509486-Alexandrium_andersonii.AAC.1